MSIYYLGWFDIFDKTIHKKFFHCPFMGGEVLQRTKVCDIMHTTTMQFVVEYPFRVVVLRWTVKEFVHRKSEGFGR